MNAALMLILLVVVVASAIFATIAAPVASADGVISDLLPFELARGVVGIGVDAVNTFPVSAGRFAYFRVVSRRQFPRFHRSRLILERVRFPAAPQRRAVDMRSFFVAHQTSTTHTKSEPPSTFTVAPVTYPLRRDAR
jgi:hypothetical protein